MRYIYIVVTKDTSLTKISSIIGIDITKKGADKYMNPCREMYQYDIKTQSYAKVCN